MAGAERRGILRQGEGEVVAFRLFSFLLLNQQRAAVGALERGRFGHASAPGGRERLLRRIRDVDGGERFSGIDFRVRLRPAGQQGLQQRLVFLQFDGSDRSDRSGRQAFFQEFSLDGLGNPVRITLPAAAEAQMQHGRAKSQHREIA